MTDNFDADEAYAEEKGRRQTIAAIIKLLDTITSENPNTRAAAMAYSDVALTLLDVSVDICVMFDLPLDVYLDKVRVLWEQAQNTKDTLDREQNDGASASNKAVNMTSGIGWDLLGGK